MSNTITPSVASRYHNKVSFGTTANTQNTTAKPNNPKGDSFISKHKKEIIAGSIIAAVTALITTAIAYTRGKTVNVTNGNESKLFSNISEGFKSFFGKNKEAYKAIVEKKNIELSAKQPDTGSITRKPDIEEVKNAPDLNVNNTTPKQPDAVIAPVEEVKKPAEIPAKSETPEPKTTVAAQEIQEAANNAADKTKKILSGNWKERIENMSGADSMRIPEGGISEDVAKALDTWNPKLVQTLNDEELSNLLYYSGRNKIDNQLNYLVRNSDLLGIPAKAAKKEYDVISSLKNNKEKADAFVKFLKKYLPKAAENYSSKEAFDELARDEFAAYIEGIGKNFTPEEVNDIISSKSDVRNMWKIFPSSIAEGKSSAEEAIQKLLEFKKFV